MLLCEVSEGYLRYEARAVASVGVLQEAPMHVLIRKRIMNKPIIMEELKATLEKFSLL